MAVVWMDGFDHYKTATNEPLNNGWTGASGFNNVYAGNRFATNSGLMIFSTTIGTGHIEKRDLVATQDMTVGFAHYEDTSVSSINLCNFYYTTDTLCEVKTDSIGRIQVDDASSSLLETSTQMLSVDDWHYIEIECHAHSTSGTIEVWVDGVQWIDQTVGTIDTGPSNLIDGVRFISGPDTFLDDVYITDDLSKLDAPRIVTLYPDGQGNGVAWTGDYTNVDNVGNDAAVDDTFIDSTVATNKEGFTYPSLPSGTWVPHCVRPIIRAINWDATTPQIKVISGDGAGAGTGALTDSIVLTSQYETEDIIWPFYDGSSTAWTGGGGGTIASLEVEVEYKV